MKQQRRFKLYFSEEYFKSDDILVTESVKCKVLSTPKSRWWLKLLQYVTFGWYKAPWYYKCKIIE